ncbi:unknown protein [Paenibacillus amylolyticus]|uniref:Uncharacterized protein n=1 Tax=Paenibacillus amylolyticus TaxID=1451 RepID=A0A124DXB5_PAEAM|nr:unknown protein [Paenibacillus amylolyticus]
MTEKNTESIKQPTDSNQALKHCLIYSRSTQKNRVIFCRSQKNKLQNQEEKCLSKLGFEKKGVTENDVGRYIRHDAGHSGTASRVPIHVFAVRSD